MTGRIAAQNQRRDFSDGKIFLRVQQNQSGDLMKLLFSKGQGRVKKYLKKNSAITLGQAAKLCEGLEARQPFSANKAVVKDARDFADQLLSYMVKTGQVEKRGAEYFPAAGKKK